MKYSNNRTSELVRWSGVGDEGREVIFEVDSTERNGNANDGFVFSTLLAKSVHEL